MLQQYIDAFGISKCEIKTFSLVAQGLPFCHRLSSVTQGNWNFPQGISRYHIKYTRLV